MALSLIHPLHKSLGHAVRFLTTDLLQEPSLQITMKSSCHFLFNHLGLPTLQNSTQFSNSNSLIPLATNRLPYIVAARTTQYRKHSFSVSLAARIACRLATVAARTTENTASVLLAACVLRALSSNGSMHHNITFTFHASVSMSPSLAQCRTSKYIILHLLRTFTSLEQPLPMNVVVRI
jgi:hypothetical protein